MHGEQDEQVPPDAIYKLVERLSIQKGVTIDIDIVQGQSLLTDHLDPMIERMSTYLDKTLTSQILTRLLSTLATVQHKVVLLLQQ